MSIQALTWAFSQQIRPATRKLVLICLSDSANHENVAWPCIETLGDKTSLDRKTIINALDDLERSGYLLDTGARRGRTNQVKVYRLNGMPSSKFHYVYRVEAPSGEFYIGVRSSCNEPMKDTYFGSGPWPTEMLKKNIPLTKTILATFETRFDAEGFEVNIVSENLKNDLCRNKTVPKSESLPNSSVFPKQESRFYHETVPFFPAKDTENGTRNPKEPKENPNGTMKPPISPKGDLKNVGKQTASEIYQAYPRRVGRGAALKAIERALRRHSQENLLETTMNFEKLWRGRDLQFCPHPSTFFNQDRFLDPLELQKPHENNGTSHPVNHRNVGIAGDAAARKAALAAAVQRKSEKSHADAEQAAQKRMAEEMAGHGSLPPETTSDRG